jgi:hypothetical protein
MASVSGPGVGLQFGGDGWIDRSDLGDLLDPLDDRLAGVFAESNLTDNG